MDITSYKQCKTIWRLILRYCTIETAVSVFQTCKENNELSKDESLWEAWYLRDFKKKGGKKSYINHYSFGVSFFFNNSCVRNFNSEDIKKVRYLFMGKGNYFLTFGQNSNPETRIFKHITSDKFYSERGLYLINPEEQRILKIGGGSLKQIYLVPLIKWIQKRFKVSNFEICPNVIGFHGTVHNGYEIYNQFGISTITYFIISYVGKFTSVSDCEVYICKDNVREDPPKIKND